jgi:FtsP/CotA-like multicopper oxidase with cupredoxin domain
MSIERTPNRGLVAATILLGACAPEAAADKPWPVPPLSELPIPSGSVPIPEPETAPDLDPADGIVAVSLVADEMTFERAGIVIDGCAFNGQVPDQRSARRSATCSRSRSPTISTRTRPHWHGPEVPWDQDGITWMSDPIAPGETRLYTFPLTHAGTFWYHPHMDVAHQVDPGTLARSS